MGAKKDLQGPPASGGLCVIGFLVSAERLAQYEDSQLAIDHRVDPWCDVSFARLVMVRSTDYERCAAPGTRRQSGKPRPKLSCQRGVVLAGRRFCQIRTDGPAFHQPRSSAWNWHLWSGS